MQLCTKFCLPCSLALFAHQPCWLAHVQSWLRLVCLGLAGELSLEACPALACRYLHITCILSSVQYTWPHRAECLLVRLCLLKVGPHCAASNLAALCSTCLRVIASFDLRSAHAAEAAVNFMSNVLNKALHKQQVCCMCVSRILQRADIMLTAGLCSSGRGAAHGSSSHRQAWRDTHGSGSLDQHSTGSDHL